VRHACTFHNSSIDPVTKQSPHQKFTGDPAPWQMKDFRIFGCPVFVLDKWLQGGDSLPKWKGRCWTGVYVGHSLQHAGNIPLVYNPLTTHVSPQYHLTFDNQFTTVTGSMALLPEKEAECLYKSSDWIFPYAFGDVDDLYLFQDFWTDPSSPVHTSQSTKRIQARNPTRRSRPEHKPILTSRTKPNMESPNNPIQDATNAGEQADAGERADASKQADASEPSDDNTHAEFAQPHLASSSTPYISLMAAPVSAANATYQLMQGLNANLYTAHSTLQTTASPRFESQASPLTECSSIGHRILSYAFTVIDGQSVSLTESDNKQDILTQAQMIKAPDADKFVACQQDEITSLYDLDIMEALPMESLPPRARLLSSIWSYRRKRLPNGVLSKYKSRLCVNGKEQKFGRDYWETYAPVANWSTIRLLLYLSTILNIKTRQVDYTSAFPQADLDVPVYMRIPQRWYVGPDGKLAQHNNPKHNSCTHYLRLKKNLYGCKQTARNWFKKLSEGLQTEDFVQSATDTCLFLRRDCIIVVYVDDCLFFAPQASTIDRIIASLSKTFKIKDEGDVLAFLGVHITRDMLSKTISFTQPGLIDQIIRDIGITFASKGKDTPVDSILHPDTDKPEHIESWNYRSLIGKLNDLANNTRPDISMAMHQCARFCQAPKALYELAVKRIAQYLLATKNNGMILRPNKSFALDMYVDADFAGRWHKEFSHLRESDLSRTGYVVTYCECPVSWASKLQSEIALLTTESEYIALSTATRQLLPLRRILQHIVTHSFVSLSTTDPDSIANPSFKSVISPSRVYKDNTACIVLATMESSFKPRTKHISFKFHHFHDQIHNGSLLITKVESAQNWADIFTKPLGRIKFEHLRRLLLSR
jgi:hypothetical protein